MPKLIGSVSCTLTKAGLRRMKRHRAREILVVGVAACLARSLRRGAPIFEAHSVVPLAKHLVAVCPPRQGVKTLSSLRSLHHFFGLHRGPCSTQRIFRCIEGASTCPELGPIREGCHVVTSSQSNMTLASDGIRSHLALQKSFAYDIVFF